MKSLVSVLIFLLLAAAAVAEPAAPVSPTAASGAAARTLSTVRWPCSLAHVAEELSRRSLARVTVAGDLAPLRVVWSYRSVPDLNTALARIAELTDSRVSERPRSVDGRPRFLLERKPSTPRLESAWRVEAVLHTLRELFRAADLQDRDQRQATDFTPGLKEILKQGRVAHNRAARYLNETNVAQLLRGERVTLSPGTVPDAELERLVRELHPFDPDLAPPEAREIYESDLKRVRQRGIYFQFEFGRRPQVLLGLGSSASPICSFGPEELGVPLTRTNPYRLLEAPGQNPPAPGLPASFQRRLEADISVSADRRWESTAQALARGAGIDLISDAFLCREAREAPRATGREILAAKGATVRDALDALCRKYEAVWWQKEGVVYCRSRLWAWDVIYETPDRFLDLWSAAIRARRPIGVREIEELASLSDGQFHGLEWLSGRFIHSQGLATKDALVRAFLVFFRQCVPADRQRLLGAGLSVPGDQDPVMTDDPQQAPAGTLIPTHQMQLGNVVVLEPGSQPPVARVELNIYTTRPGQPRIRTPMTVAIPLLPDPFQGV